MKVSLSKLVKYARPAHNNFFELLSTHCADLNGAEQLTVIMMIVSAIRETAIETYGLETIEEIESKLKKTQEGENNENQG